MELSPVPSRTAVPPLKVLVVDDNIINQKVAVKMLERLQCSSDVVSDGLEAVNVLQDRQYDLVLMDVQMPVMDGLEATRTIREQEAGIRRTIIIAVTANAIQGDRERCIESGMDDYLSKPIKQQDIERMIGKWISARNESGSKGTVSTESFVIDPSRIEQIMEIGDESLLTELLSLYLEDLKQYSAEVSSAYRENNFQSIYENSHKLKGSSANIGVDEIRQACITMEQFAKEKDASKIGEHLIVMEELIGRIILYIRTTYSLH